MSSTSKLSRRETLKLAGKLAGAAAASVSLAPQFVSPAAAALDDMNREIATITGGKPVKPGRVAVVMPELTDNGNSTSIAITVESPMTAGDHVKALHILSEKNPVPYITRIGLGPHAGRAKVSTSIRVADSQKFTVIAEMSDGSFWSGQAQTEVTTPACIDDSDKPQ